MTAFDFSLVKNTSFAFAAATDSLNLGAVDAASLTATTSGSNLILTIGTDKVTLTGASIEQVTTSNITFGTATTRSAWAVGDNVASTTFDANGNTIDIDATPSAPFTTGYAAAQADANHLVYGLGGGDTITVGNGDSKIFGGTGTSDSVDGNDTITVGTGGNTVYANAGNDTVALGITTAGKTNTIYLGLGNDSLTSGAIAGNAVVYGNSGEDNINLATAIGTTTIFGGNGESDSTDGADTIAVGTGAATVYANAGNDILTVAGTLANKAVTIYAGLGNDSITTAAAVATTASNVLFGGTGNDTIDNALFTGTSTIYGGNSAFDSTDGADRIMVGLGSTIVYANAGADAISVTGALAATTDTVIVHTGAGNDTVTATSNGAVDIDVAFYSNSGDDTFALSNNGTNNYDYTLGDFAAGDVVQYTLDGAAGATQLTVSGGGSSLTLDDAGNGSISFQGYAGDLNATNFVISDGSVLATNFSGTAATLTGGAGVDQIVSGSSADTIVGTAGADKLVGGAGNDTFQFTDALASGTATIQGGEGTDILEITGTTAAGLVNGDLANITSVETLKLNNVTGQSVVIAANAVTAGLVTIDAAALTGANTANITASGFAAALTYLGGAGNDTVDHSGQAFKDTLTLGAGADSAILGGGADSVDGGAGIDSFSFLTADLTSADTIVGGADADKILISDAATVIDSAFTSVTTVESVELALGGTLTIAAKAQAAGILTVNSANAATTVDGSAYTVGFTVNGSTANDSITGGTAGDSLFGGTGADTLVGGAGDDLLTGGVGADTLTGGTGSDSYSFESIILNANGETISEFVAGAGGDKYQLDAGSALNGLTNGGTVVLQTVAGIASTANRIVADTTANLGALGVTIGDQTALALDIFYAVNTQTGALFYDANGDWSAGSVQIGTVTLLTGTLTADNFSIA